jgi:sulfate permease, SulP family
MFKTRLKHQFSQRLNTLNALNASQWLSHLALGLTTGAIGVIFALSYAVLIFSGNLSAQLSTGVGLVLFSIATTRAAIALTSSYPGMVADLGTVPTAILAWSVGMIAKSLPVGTSSNESMITVIVAIALTSVLTGAAFLLLGYLQLGKVVRWMPQPVLGGFIASTGWLLLKGAFKVMTDKPLELAQLPLLTQPKVLIYWLPGVLLGTYLLIVSKRCKHPVLLSISLLASVALFYLSLPMLGSSVAQASANGWTLSIPVNQSSRSIWQLANGFILTSIHWDAIAAQWMCIATVVVTATISLLMNVSGLALVTQKDINANRELKVAGVSNLLLGLLGGVLSFQSLSKSVLSYKMGNPHRLTTLIDAGVIMAVPLMGTSLLAYFPKPVLGGLLVFLGLSLLLEWVLTAWFKLSKIDYFIVQLIWIVSVAVGFLQGLTLGWLLAALLVPLSAKRAATIQ